MRISVYIVQFGTEVPGNILAYISEWDKTKTKYTLQWLPRIKMLLQPGGEEPDVVFIVSATIITVFLQPEATNASCCLYDCSLSPYTLKQSDIHNILDKAYDLSLGEYLEIVYRNKRSYIRFDQIVSISVTNHSLTVNATHDSITVRLQLNEIENRLPSCFLKCNRSEIVNKNHISLMAGEKIRMTDGTVIYATNGYMAYIHSRIKSQQKADYPFE